MADRRAGGTILMFLLRSAHNHGHVVRMGDGVESAQTLANPERVSLEDDETLSQLPDILERRLVLILKRSEA